MCGIAGWFDMTGDRPADRALVRAMTETIRHRGPDGDGYHFSPGVGLGHRRLAVIDLNTGDQPMFNASKTTCIVYNGEIYNFKQLRSELQSLGRRFTSKSDTEVIIQAYDEWGPDFVERLTGMFAFALWDEKERSLLLAHDRIGEKPLYYALLPNGTLVFASELKGLLVHPLVHRTIDPCAIEEFFALGYVADPRTIYKSVSKLPPASTLLVRRGRRPALKQYWDATPATDSAKSGDVTDALIERLGAIVQSQLVADVPVGAFLSGGTDSSGTTALMARATSESVAAFTIGFKETGYDETEFASEVARKYQLQHIVERLDGSEIDVVRRLPRMFDEPFGDSSALPSCYLMQLARKHVTVALSGDGGDELFAGYRRYGFHTREEFLRKLMPASIRRPLFGALGRLYPQLDWAPRPFRARHTFREMSLDTVMGFFWNVSVVDDDLRGTLFSGSLGKELGGYSAADVIRRYMDRAPSDDPLTRAQYVDIKTWLPGDILTKVDRTAMAFSLEVRVPMLDHHFVEWALGLPRAMKLAKGRSKVALKQAFERLVPANLLYRPKQGFTVPLASWFRGSLGAHFEDEIRSRQGLDESGYFDGKLVRQLLAQHRSGLHDHSRVLWLLWMFQRFLTDVDAAAVPPVPAVA